MSLCPGDPASPLFLGDTDRDFRSILCSFSSERSDRSPRDLDRDRDLSLDFERDRESRRESSRFIDTDRERESRLAGERERDLDLDMSLSRDFWLQRHKINSFRPSPTLT